MRPPRGTKGNRTESERPIPRQRRESRPYVSHMQFRDGEGRQVTLFPAFRSTETLDQISRIPSPVKASTIPKQHHGHDGDAFGTNYHELVREYGPSKNDPGFLYGKDEIYKSESNPTVTRQNLEKLSINTSIPPKRPPVAPPVPPVSKIASSNGAKKAFTRNSSTSSAMKTLQRKERQQNIRQERLESTTSAKTYKSAEPAYPTSADVRKANMPRMRYIYAFPEEFREWIKPLSTQPSYTRSKSICNAELFEKSLLSSAENAQTQFEETASKKSKIVESGMNTEGAQVTAVPAAVPKALAPRRTISFDPHTTPSESPSPRVALMDELRARLAPPGGANRYRSSATTTTTTATQGQETSQHESSFESDPVFSSVPAAAQVSPETNVSTSNASFSYRPRPRREAALGNPIRSEAVTTSISSSAERGQTAKNQVQTSQTSQTRSTGTTTNTAQRSFRKSDFRKLNPEVAQLLKDTPSHIQPAVEHFILNHFENPQKALENAEYSESDFPMKHYWQRVFKVKDGKKNATIKIENLLSIEPEIGPFQGYIFEGLNNNGKAFESQMEMASSSTYRRKMSLDSSELAESKIVHARSGTVNSAESGFSSDSPVRGQSPDLHDSDDNGPMPASMSPTDVNLLTVVLKKIRQRKPIDWPELFLLKNDHCRFVIGREKELRRLRLLHPVPAEATLLERDIVDNYRCYQRALEDLVVVDELYTRLAHHIMRAEAYWYAAKITSDGSLKHHFYSLAKHNYADLLIDARSSLAPDDRSLLTILDKMTQILVEAGTDDSQSLINCQDAVYQAEKALEVKPDIKKERKIIKIKNTLMSLTSR
uniref:RanBP2-type domain-containing protein n=1 Tax=Panagrellus redivivus TaxID=6233 RepID=A0A7E4UYM9_PANRE